MGAGLFISIYIISLLDIILFYISWISASKLSGNTPAKSNTSLYIAIIAIIVFLVNIWISSILSNADYGISLFLLLLSLIGVMVALRSCNADIISANPIYNNAKKIAATKYSKLEITENILRTLNLIIIAPIFALCLGGVYRAYGSSSDANLLVFSAIIATIIYSIVLIWYSSTKKNIMALAISIVIIALGAYSISLSPRLDTNFAQKTAH